MISVCGAEINLPILLVGLTSIVILWLVWYLNPSTERQIAARAIEDAKENKRLKELWRDIIKANNMGKHEYPYEDGTLVYAPQLISETERLRNELGRILSDFNIYRSNSEAKINELENRINELCQNKKKKQ